MLSGVDRPAPATILPTIKGVPSHLLLDVGANVDCDPDNLVQFAVMGYIYAKNVLRIHNPRVGLLSIGEEESKGNSLTRDTLPLLRALTSINFTGNVEGAICLTARSDVAVCDGFVGNVALKSIGERPNCSAHRCVNRSGRHLAGRSRSFRARRSTSSKSDSTTRSMAAPSLLGVRGVCIIGHWIVE